MSRVALSRTKELEREECKWKRGGSVTENAWPGGPRRIACLNVDVCGKSFRSISKNHRLCGACRSGFSRPEPEE